MTPQERVALFKQKAFTAADLSRAAEELTLFKPARKHEAILRVLEIPVPDGQKKLSYSAAEERVEVLDAEYATYILTMLDAQRDAGRAKAEARAAELAAQLAVNLSESGAF